jgi:hypothetical protein
MPTARYEFSFPLDHLPIVSLNGRMRQATSPACYFRVRTIGTDMNGTKLRGPKAREVKAQGRAKLRAPPWVNVPTRTSSNGAKPIKPFTSQIPSEAYRRAIRDRYGPWPCKHQGMRICFSLLFPSPTSRYASAKSTRLRDTIAGGSKVPSSMPGVSPEWRLLKTPFGRFFSARGGTVRRSPRADIVG